MLVTKNLPMQEITAQQAEEQKMSYIDVMRVYKADITEEEADYILWNATCYPFSPEMVVKDIFDFFNNTNNKNL